MSKNLPAGWAEAQLGDCLLSIVGGGTPSRNVARYFEGAIPWFTVKDMKSLKPSDAEEHISGEAVANSATNVVPPDTLICATRIALGRAIRPTVECAINQDLKALIVGAGVDSDFLLYWTLANEQMIQSKGTGTTVSGIRLETLRSLPLLLPPSLEQIRIVQKLEELLSDLDEGVAELRKAESKLLSYRQSLLKSALEGHLTTDWRAANGKPKEAGADLLQRILSERRAHWEKKQLAKFKEQGKAPPKNWQAKYPVPLVPDVTDLPALPEGWAWTSLDTLIEDGPQNGLYLSSDHYGRGTEILRIDDYQTGWYREREALNRVEADASTLTTYALKLGDIVINRVNSVTHLGKCLRVPASLSGVLFESNMMRLRLTEAASTNFVAFYLGSANGRSRLIRDAKWAVNQASINQQDVRRTPIPLPSIEEQIVIADLLDFHQTAIDAQLAAIDSSLKRVAVQRKVLLKAAFTGQLVPQDPNDEPASELLARIRAARDSKAGGSIASKRGRKPKVAP